MTGVKKGTVSQRARVASAVLSFSKRTGFAAAQGDIEAELKSIAPAHHFNVGLSIASLCNSGVLSSVYGRPPHTRYAHRDLPTTRVPATEPMAAAVEVVEREWGRTRRELPTRVVTDGMRALGVDLPHPNNYRLILDALTRPSSRGAPSWREPRLAVRTVTSLGGRERTLWRPAGAAIAGEHGPLDHADAAMQAVARAEACLGRPVSRSDVALWVTAFAEQDDIARHLKSTGTLGRALEQLSERRLGRLVNGRENWQVLRSAFTVPGGPPERYTTREMNAILSTAVELEDRLLQFIPARELESIQALDGLAGRLQSPALDSILALRRGLVPRVSLPATPVALITTAREALVAANDMRLEWAARFPVNERAGKVAPYVALRGELDAIEDLQPSPVRRASRSPVRIVGDAATASHGELLPYASCVPLLLQQTYASDESLRMFYDGARRLPNSAARWEQNARDGSLIPDDRRGQGWLLVDRVDALTLIWATAELPRSTSLLATAHTVLGHTLRDPQVLSEALAVTPPTRGEIRRPLLIALSLLGEPTALEEGVSNPGDEMDTVAWLLAAVLSTPDRARLGQAMAAAYQRASSSEARRAITEAMRALDAGLLLSVVG